MRPELAFLRGYYGWLRQAEQYRLCRDSGLI
jgi:hypothetical protein